MVLSCWRIIAQVEETTSCKYTQSGCLESMKSHTTCVLSSVFFLSRPSMFQERSLNMAGALVGGLCVFLLGGTGHDQ